MFRLGNMANGKLQPFINLNQSKHHCYTLSTTCTLFTLASDVGPRTIGRSVDIIDIISYMFLKLICQCSLYLLLCNCDKV